MQQAEMNSERAATENKYLTFARFVLVAVIVAAGVAFTLYLVWYAADLLMLIFAGILVSILLRGIGRFIRQKTGISHSFSVGLVALALLVLIVVTGWLMAGRLGTQFTQLQQTLPQAVESVKQYVGQNEWARDALARLPNPDDWLASRGGTIVSRLTGIASTAFGAVLNTVVVFILGLYFAFQPELYSGGVKHLLPFRFRERAGEVFGELDEALWRWLGGRFLLMFVNGGLTALGLWMLGVPLALTLGILAGVLNFIPNFGPWIAAVPAVLVGFMHSPQTALYVALLYLALQSIDAYVLTPLIDRKSVELPPVLTIAAQLLLGIAFGILGLLLASPLMAAVMILVKMLYVEDVIGDPVMEESETADDESGDDYVTRNGKSDARQTGDAMDG